MREGFASFTKILGMAVDIFRCQIRLACKLFGPGVTTDTVARKYLPNFSIFSVITIIYYYFFIDSVELSVEKRSGYKGRVKVRNIK